MTDENAPGALRWTPLDTRSAPAWSELTNLLATVERTEEFYSAEDLAEELDEPGFDPEHDSWAVWDGSTLVAFGQLRVADELVDNRCSRAQLDGGVHPDWRGKGIGTALLDAMQARARELSAERHPGAPLQLRAPGRLPGDPVRPLLERRGFVVARYFTDMERTVPGEPLPPADDRVRPYSADLMEAVRLAHNDAFATHWGSTSQTPERWRDRLASRTFRPDTSTVWIDDGGDEAAGGSHRPDSAGAVLAYVLTYQWVDGELYIGQVGTRQHARGRGLARACLLGTLNAAAASGEYHLVDLAVDSANPTGAGRLYESVGFVPTRTVATYVREEPAPPVRKPTTGSRGCQDAP